MPRLYLALSAVVMAIVFVSTLVQSIRKDTDSQSSLYTYCEESTPTQTTTIDFLLDPALRASVNIDRLQTWIDTGNTVLANSCLNVRREMGLVVETKNSYVHFLETNDPKRLRHHLKKNEAEQYAFDNHPHRILVFVAPFVDEDIVGYSWPTLYDDFVLLTTNVMVHTLEHELGHLAGAEHEKTKLELLKDFLPFVSSKHGASAATTCSGKQTIMSQLTHPDSVILAYSSPLTSYQGETCGNEKYADNRSAIEQYYHQFSLQAP